MENVFLKLESNKNENEDTIIKLLRNTNPSLDINLKSEIIRKQNNKISNIEDVSKDLWDELVDDNKLKPSWKNIQSYFETIESFDYLEHFLNNKENYTQLSGEMIGCGNDELDVKFIHNLINSNISDDSFNYLVKSINKTYNEISILETTNLNKLSALINSKKVDLTSENIEYLFENDKNDKRLYITLIELNENIFKDKLDEFDLNEEMIFNLIVNSVLSEETIEILVMKFDTNITSFNPNKLNEIAEHLSKIKLIDFSYELYVKLIENSNQTLKIKLLTQHFETLDIEGISHSLNLIGEPFSKIPIKDKSFEVINNPDNYKLLNLLKGTFVKTIYNKINGNLSVAYLS